MKHIREIDIMKGKVHIDDILKATGFKDVTTDRNAEACVCTFAHRAGLKLSYSQDDNSWWLAYKNNRGIIYGSWNGVSFALLYQKIKELTTK